MCLCGQSSSCRLRTNRKFRTVLRANKKEDKVHQASVSLSRAMNVVSEWANQQRLSAGGLLLGSRFFLVHEKRQEASTIIDIYAATHMAFERIGSSLGARVRQTTPDLVCVGAMAMAYRGSRNHCNASIGCFASVSRQVPCYM